VEEVVENKDNLEVTVALVEAVEVILALVEVEQQHKVTLVEELDTEVMVVMVQLVEQALVVVEAQVVLVHLVHKVLVVVLVEITLSQMVLLL
tara:strand:- start:95 stop:370 length:276 start_codon:yes stop_codon:yes gene_type:complete